MNNFNYKNMTPFKWFVLENFPFIENDFEAINNYRLFSKVVEYLNKTIDNVNVLGNLVEQFSDYFDNLDVQEEINNKLDEMVEAGTLQEIIADYLNSQAIFGYDNVNDMKQATNLIDGSYAKTLGFYSKNDGGMATYKIRTITNEDIIDNMFLIAMNNQNLVAELIINSDFINILQLGAKSNDKTNDVSIIINKINEKSFNAFIPNGNFYSTNTILINAENGTIKGNSSKSRIYVNDTFNGTELMEVFTLDGDYYTKSRRQETIENLTLSGTNEQNKTINGLKIGGDTGSQREGHVDLIQFNNIYLYKFDKSLYLNSHVYKNNYYNIVTDDCNFAIYSDINQTDMNEATNFIGCAFWGGSIYLKQESNFIGCTLHFNHNELINNTNCYCYINQTLVNFTDCHFEDINRLGTQTNGYENIFIAEQSILNFNNSIFLITGDYEKITNSFFKTIISTSATSGKIAKINLENTDMKYLLGRINKNVPQSNFVLCKGDVIINSITKYAFDTLSSLNYKIYDYSTNFTTLNDDLNPVILTNGFKGATITEANSEITVSDSPTTATSKWGIYKKIPVGTHKALNYRIDLECEKTNVHFMTKINSTDASCIYFIDEFGNRITSSNNADITKDEATHFIQTCYINIPANAKYIMFGLGGYGASYQYPITLKINELICELV